jgi:hypothetical protein
MVVSCASSYIRVPKNQTPRRDIQMLKAGLGAICCILARHFFWLHIVALCVVTRKARWLAGSLFLSGRSSYGLCSHSLDHSCLLQHRCHEHATWRISRFCKTGLICLRAGVANRPAPQVTLETICKLQVCMFGCGVASCNLTLLYIVRLYIYSRQLWVSLGLASWNGDV